MILFQIPLRGKVSGPHVCHDIPFTSVEHRHASVFSGLVLVATEAASIVGGSQATRESAAIKEGGRPAPCAHRALAPHVAISSGTAAAFYVMPSSLALGCVLVRCLLSALLSDRIHIASPNAFDTIFSLSLTLSTRAWRCQQVARASNLLTMRV